MLSEDESRRSPLKVRTRGNKSKAACVVVLHDSPFSNHLLEPALCPNKISDCDFDLTLSIDPSNLCLHSFAIPRGPWSLERFDSDLVGSFGHNPKMASASANTPNVAPINQGSGGGTVDLLMSRVEDGSIARNSCAVITIAYDQGNRTLPKFQKGIEMDISHAYMWHTAVNLPIFVALSFWFMTGTVDDERTRVWLFNLYRYACEDDCKRSLAQFMGRVKLITKAMKSQVGKPGGRGLVEIFAETDLFQNVDNFWSDFQNLVEGRCLTGVHISATLEGACASLRDGSLVNTGYLLEHPKHVIFWHMIRDRDWHHMFQVYRDFESEYLVPTPAHVIYLINRVLQAAQDLTLAIRLKNDLVINDGKGPDAMINEIDVVSKADCEQVLPWP